LATSHDSGVALFSWLGAMDVKRTDETLSLFLFLFLSLCPQLDMLLLIRHCNDEQTLSKESEKHEEKP
jgi:hypothetical protein